MKKEDDIKFAVLCWDSIFFFFFCVGRIASRENLRSFTCSMGTLSISQGESQISVVFFLSHRPDTKTKSLYIKRIVPFFLFFFNSILETIRVLKNNSIKNTTTTTFRLNRHFSMTINCNNEYFESAHCKLMQH